MGNVCEGKAVTYYRPYKGYSIYTHGGRNIILTKLAWIEQTPPDPIAGSNEIVQYIYPIW